MVPQIQKSKKERNIYLQEKAEIQIEWEIINFESLNTKKKRDSFQNSPFYLNQVNDFINYWSLFHPVYPRRERPLSRETVSSHVQRIATIFGFFHALKYELNFDIVFDSEKVKLFFYQVGYNNNIQLKKSFIKKI